MTRNTEKNVSLFAGRYTCQPFYIDYGSLTWGGTANTHLLKLKRTLNKAMRIMAFRNKYESAKP